MSLVLDSPTERTVYESLTEEQQLTFLEHLRERRLSALKVYEELQASKKLATNEKLVAKAERLSKKMAKGLETALKAITSVEDCYKAVQAIRIEME
jgi:ABC-type uncharacterized transport system ATPase subunit